MKLIGLVIGVMVAACAPKSASVPCEDGRVCPEGTICDVEHTLCVTPEQIAQCEEQSNRADCSMPDGSPGACDQGVCIASVCGNARLDRLVEVCDDGDNEDMDGCSRDCRSEETCGNQIVDVLVGEACDDGGLLDHDGCSSACQHETLRWQRVAPAPGPLSQARAVYDAARGKVVMFGGRIYADGASATQGAAPPDSITTQALWEWDPSGWRLRDDIEIAPVARDIDERARPNVVLVSFGLAYDHGSRATMVAGGTVAGYSTRETWAWNGAFWARLPDLPVALHGHAMAYDARRKRIVVFGGLTRAPGVSDVVHDETWEFDGTAWSQASPATSPSPRSRASMVYDPKRGVLVLVGGGAAGSLGPESEQLWEYDGTTWTQRVFSGAGYPPTLDPALAWDAVNERVMIYFNDSDSIQKLYFWDGNQLSQFTGAMPVATTTSTSAPGTTDVRVGGVLVSTGDERVMLFGGQDLGTFTVVNHLLADRLQWFYDGSAWSEPEVPTPLQYAATAEAMDRGVVVRVGGQPTSSSSPIADTWELSSRGWKRYTSGNPPAMSFASMTYDAARDELVLFGGLSADGVEDQLWVRTGSTWAQRPMSGMWPEARAATHLVYDAARREVLLFGGFGVSGNLDDTWSWNGSAWTQRTPANKPSARAYGAIGYDWARGVVVLFGGDGEDAAFTDTWIWDGTDWHDVTASLAQSPLPRVGSTLTWNPARRRLLLAQELGLVSPVFDAWEWQTATDGSLGGSWERIQSVQRPPRMAGAGAFTTLDGSGVTLLHGVQSDGTSRPDSWELRFASGKRGHDSCALAADVDGDGLMLCDPAGGYADPDCWRVCTPDCPPGTSCTADDTRCGDGECTGRETCRNCPLDCVTCVGTRCGDFVCDPGEACPGDCSP